MISRLISHCVPECFALVSRPENNVSRIEKALRSQCEIRRETLILNNSICLCYLYIIYIYIYKQRDTGIRIINHSNRLQIGGNGGSGSGTLPGEVSSII